MYVYVLKRDLSFYQKKKKKIPNQETSKIVVTVQTVLDAAGLKCGLSGAEQEKLLVRQGNLLALDDWRAHFLSPLLVHICTSPCSILFPWQFTGTH